MPDQPTLTLKAIIENVPAAIDWVTRKAQLAGLDGRTLYQIQVAVDEACANVVQHAYVDMEPGNLEISCYPEEQAFVIRIRDWGRGFAPDEIDDPDIGLPLEERSTGGLGLFLMRQFMDHVAYSFDAERGNELVMKKDLPSADQL
jgi:anti-sigma regulatory factor (Ser/Thr protein kinase)